MALHFPAGSSQFLTFSINFTKGRLILKSLSVDPRTFSSLFMCFACCCFLQAILNSENSHSRFYKNTGLFFPLLYMKIFILYINTVYSCQIASNVPQKSCSDFFFPSLQKDNCVVRAEMNALSALKPPSYLTIRVVLFELVMPYT